MQAEFDQHAEHDEAQHRSSITASSVKARTFGADVVLGARCAIVARNS